MFFSCEHEYHEDQFGGKEHLDKEALGYARSAAKGCINVHRGGKEGADYGSGACCGYHLSEEDGDGAEGFDGAYEVEAECDLSTMLDLEIMIC